MKKAKYNLSKYAVDQLMKSLEAISKENFENINNKESETVGLLEAKITTDFVKTMTKVKDLDDVIARNDKLTKSFRGLVNMYGFETLYDMYIYAMSCDTIPEELWKKNKNYSQLVPVKRKVMRNGKEYNVTVWVDPNKTDNNKEDMGTGTDKDKGKNTNEQTKVKIRHARELDSTVVGGDEVKNPKKVAELKVLSSKLKKGNNRFKDDSDYYIVLRDEGNVYGIIGYSESEDGKYLVMDFYRSNGEIAGVATKGFFELLKLAVEKGKGVKMEDIPVARGLFIKTGLEQQSDSSWVIEAKNLKELMHIERGTET